MNKTVKKILALSLCGVTLCTVLSACTGKKRVPEIPENTIEYTKASKKLNDGSLNSCITLKKGDVIEADFEKETEFDTVALYEKGDGCNEFKLYAEKDGEWELIYDQDRILAYHLCFVGKTTTQKLRLEITDCSDDGVKLREMSVYSADKTDREVRVTQYLRLDVNDFSTLVGDSGFSGYYDVVTDPILFGEVSLDENASVCFNHSEEFFASQLESFRKILGERTVNIWCCVAFDKGESRDYETTSNFVRNNIDTISKNLKAFVEKYGLYGIDYDWEYPTKKSHWKAYDLIVEETAKFTEVSVALPPWGIKFSKSAREAITNVNVMAYDLFDGRGDHSSAYTGGYEAIEKVREFGFDASQILLGIPTYGRTVDKSEYAWPTIRDDGGDFGEWGKFIENYSYKNSDTGENGSADAYLNSYAEARDKTATAIDEEIGGVMIFRAFCDAPFTSEYSLTRAIGEAIAERSE